MAKADTLLHQALEQNARLQQENADLRTLLKRTRWTHDTQCDAESEGTCICGAAAMNTAIDALLNRERARWAPS